MYYMIVLYLTHFYIKYIASLVIKRHNSRNIILVNIKWFPSLTSVSTILKLIIDTTLDYYTLQTHNLKILSNATISRKMRQGVYKTTVTCANPS